MTKVLTVDHERLEHLLGLRTAHHAKTVEITQEINRLSSELDAAELRLARRESDELSGADNAGGSSTADLRKECLHLRQLMEQAEEDRRAARDAAQSNGELFARCKTFLENSQ